MKATMTVLFYGRKSKTTTDGLIPIYMRVTISGSRFEISTMKYVPINQWSKRSERLRGTHTEARMVNAFLDSLRAKAFEHQRQIVLEGAELTVETFRNRWSGIEDRPNMLLEIFKYHHYQFKQLIGKAVAHATWQRYETSLDHTPAFILYKYNKPDIAFNKIKFDFITEYEFLLKAVRNCNHNTAMKYLANFKRSSLISVKNGWCSLHPGATGKGKQNIG